MEDTIEGFMRDAQEYPYGPRSEKDAILAAKEVGPDGFLTGGPSSPDEWLHWNGAMAAGWGGRWPIPVGGYPEGTVFATNIMRSKDGT